MQGPVLSRGLAMERAEFVGQERIAVKKLVLLTFFTGRQDAILLETQPRHWIFVDSFRLRCD